MNSKFQFLLCTVLIVILSSNIQAQTFGKIITKKEANILFGPVIDSVKISSASLDTIIAKTDKVTMFFVKKSKIAIKGDKQKVLYNNGVKLDSTDVFNKFSKSILKELLLSGSSIKAKDIMIEKRSTVMTITSGDLTLEFGIGCPPLCD